MGIGSGIRCVWLRRRRARAQRMLGRLFRLLWMRQLRLLRRLNFQLLLLLLLRGMLLLLRWQWRMVWRWMNGRRRRRKPVGERPQHRTRVEGRMCRRINSARSRKPRDSRSGKRGEGILSRECRESSGLWRCGHARVMRRERLPTSGTERRWRQRAAIGGKPAKRRSGERGCGR